MILSAKINAAKYNFTNFDDIQYQAMSNVQFYYFNLNGFL